MRADQLQQAARQVATIVERSNLLTAIRQCRESRGEQRKAALAQLGSVAAALMNAIGRFDNHSRKLLESVHLASLDNPTYWRSLLSDQTNENARQAELVRLYSRAMFASSHLPSLVNLVDGVDTQQASLGPVPVDGQDVLLLQLTDAGEKASDPDRIARTIDGIDMIYSASASVVSRSTMDLDLARIDGTDHREIVFLGEFHSIAMVKSVIQSIPDAIARVNPDVDVDIQELVLSLPIFRDLQAIAQRAGLSESDVKDIQDTMHQGVLLTLESGVMLGSGQLSHQAEAPRPNPAVPVQPPTVPSPTPAQALANGNAAPSDHSDSQYKMQDEFFEQYLRERDRLSQDD